MTFPFPALNFIIPEYKSVCHYLLQNIQSSIFTLCFYTIENETVSHTQKIASAYKQVLKYLEVMRTIYVNNADFICGYDAGCLGFTLYHQLTDHNVNCVILAPTTMMEQRGRKKIKTDKRNAVLIAKCLAYHSYSPVHVPTV